MVCIHGTLFYDCGLMYISNDAVTERSPRTGMTGCTRQQWYDTHCSGRLWPCAADRAERALPKAVCN